MPTNQSMPTDTSDIEAKQDIIISNTADNATETTALNMELLLQAILRQTEVNQNIIQELKLQTELLKELNT